MKNLNIYEEISSVIDNLNSISPDDDSFNILFLSKESLISSTITRAVNPLGIEIISPKLIDINEKSIPENIKIKVAITTDIAYENDSGESVSLSGIELAKLFKRVVIKYLSILYPQANVKDIKIKYKIDESLKGEYEKYKNYIETMKSEKQISLSSIDETNSSLEEMLKRMERNDPEKVEKCRNSPTIGKSIDILNPIFTLAKYGINVDIDTLFHSLMDNKSRSLKISVPETSKFGWKSKHIAGVESQDFIVSMLNEFASNFGGFPPMEITLIINNGMHWGDEEYRKAELFYDNMVNTMKKFYEK